MTKREKADGDQVAKAKSGEAGDRSQGTDTQERAERGCEALAPEGTVYTFKSKFRRDQLKLFPADYATGKDGVRRIVKPTVWANFEHNTWATRDSEEAAELRRQIAEGDLKGVPLRVWESTEGV